MKLRILWILALAGCASAPPRGTPAETPGRVIASGDSYDFRIDGASGADRMRIRATPEVAWIGLPGVYEALEIPVAHVDPSSRTLGNQRHQARRRLGGEPMSTYFNCGSTLSGPIATEYEMRISVISQIMPAENPAEAAIVTRVQAAARSRDGSSATDVPCASSGRLEQRIAELLNRSIGG